MYYRGAVAAIIVFDVSKGGAWESIKTWYRDLVCYAEAGVVVCVAGNKVDINNSDPTDVELCRATCRAWGASLHLTSALTGSVTLLCSHAFSRHKTINVGLGWRSFFLMLRSVQLDLS